MSLVKIRDTLEKELNMPYKKLMAYIKFLNINIIQDFNTKYKYKSINSEDLHKLKEFCQKSNSERYSIILHKNAELKYGSYEEWKNKKTQNQAASIARNMGCNQEEAFSRILEKGRNAYKEKTGLKNPFQDIENIKNSYIKNLGVENPQERKDIKKKAVNTSRQKYMGKGCNIEKIQKTINQKYGGMGAASNVIKQHMVQSREQNLKDFCIENQYIKADEIGNPNLIKYLCEKNNIFICVKPTYGTFIKISDRNKVISLVNSFIPFKKSTPQYELLEDIKKLYKGEILANDRKIIHPKEIDIYIPEKKLGIEFDGLYWHSEHIIERNHFFDKNKHLEKTKLCEEKGIRLIHIFEDEYLFKKEKVLSIIKDALGLNIKVYARKCNFQEINVFECNQFLEKYHINEGSKSITKAYGLFYNNELLEVAGFGRNRFSKNKELELIRAASKDGIRVIGGLSKLIKDSKIEHFITFADRRMFTGNSYLKCGCEKIGETSPSYFYVNSNSLVRENRIKFQKHKLSKLLKNFDPKKSEHENMLDNGYYRIYDCGTFKFEYNRD